MLVQHGGTASERWTTTTNSQPNSQGNVFLWSDNSRRGEAQQVHNYQEKLFSNHVRKKPRRRTIYVPSDDTTILTIHPGSRKIAAEGNSLTLGDNSQSQKHAHSHIKPERGQTSVLGKKTFAAAPKRALQPTLKTLQENNECHDIFGGGPGKENYPPKQLAAAKSASGNLQTGMTKPRRVSIRFGQCQNPEPSAVDVNRDKTVAGGHGYCESKHNLAAQRRSNSGIPLQKTPLDRPARKRNSLYYNNFHGPSQRTKLVSEASTQLPHGHRNEYRILEEDISHPQMYEDEDAWLSNQETALKQLVNSLFLSMLPAEPKMAHEARRKAMLRVYQEHSCELAHKRLKASLLYGVLSPPKEASKDFASFDEDLGLRQKLIEFWLKSYDLPALAAALEVVVGRVIQDLTDTAPKIDSTSQDMKQAKAQISRKQRGIIGSFLETCIIRNEDTSYTSQKPSKFCSWRRTMLRSLMLVLLLDKVKESGVLTTNLFQSRSAIKSSKDALSALARLLSPFIADINRILAHLGFSVQHMQLPISEYQYKVENLAVDLRDGVRISLLAELLLQSSESDWCWARSAPDSGDALPPLSQDWCTLRLSQSLKFPCETRVQKLHNVRIALSALEQPLNLSADTQSYKAEDIVDGHRERTISLLWSLVGKHGLGLLVDFEELKSEILRLRKDSCCLKTQSGFPSHVLPDLIGSQTLELQSLLLHTWAREIAAKHHELEVVNLSTSFADGRVFEAIVDEYRHFIFDRPAQRTKETPKDARLDTKLLEIGCSNAFGESRQSFERTLCMS